MLTERLNLGTLWTYDLPGQSIQQRNAGAAGAADDDEEEEEEKERTVVDRVRSL